MIQFKSKVLNNVKETLVKNYVEGLKDINMDCPISRKNAVVSAAKVIINSKDFRRMVVCELLKEILDSEMDKETQNKKVN